MIDVARRRWLKALAAAGVLPAAAAATALDAPARTPLRIALGWDEAAADGRGEPVRCIGVWTLAGPQAEVSARLVVPTRAHGFTRLPGGDILAAARRPGLWLRRFSPQGTLRHEAWAEPGRQFNGHTLPGADGRVLYSIEQLHDETGTGVVALRDLLTMALQDEWETGGTDPHQLLRVDGTLFVANGGVPTRPETGRAKQALATMDSSLVAFDLATGKRSGGPWRLNDPRLSLRHLAWHPASRTLGIALQAEHDDPAARARAPLLAVFDGQRLRTVPSLDAEPTAGYAGDICATTSGFMLSATRAGALRQWSAGEGWSAGIPLAEPCALVGAPMVNHTMALGAAGGWAEGGAAPLALPPGCKPDNHALLLS